MEEANTKPKHFMSSLVRLLSYLKPYRIRLIFIILFASLSTIFVLFSPVALGNITTSLFDSVVNETSIDMTVLGKSIIVLFLLYLGSCIFNVVQGLLMSKITRNVTITIRKEIDQKLNKLPLSFYDRTSHGDILSRIVNDVDLISETFDSSLTQIITSLITIIGIVIMMVSINVWMTLVAFFVFPISLFLMSFIVKKSQHYFDRQQEVLGKLNGHIEQMYTGHIVVKACCKEKASVKEFDSINKELHQNVWKSQFLSGLMMPITNFVGNLGYVTICILGGFFAVNGTLKVGAIQAFIQYIRRFHSPIATLADITGILQSTVAASERVFEILDEQEEAKDKTNLRIDVVKGEVIFDHVSFAYPNKTRPTIKDFSIKIKSGSKVAIVGPTGAGKTTLVNLLMRFYELTSGEIRIDGVPIKKMTKPYLRSLFGVVPQDTWLFHGSVKENIAYGKKNATLKEVKEAAAQSYIDHLISTLPNEYDTIIDSEVTNISEGEKQLLTIARCFLVNPKILILDEATSSIDTRTELFIQKALKKLMKGKTSFVIAHRLSTIKNSDLIIVMDHGDIIETGTHHQLLKNKGFYYSLYHSQFQNELDEENSN